MTRAGQTFHLLVAGALISCGGGDDGGTGPGNTLVVSPASLSVADCAIGQVSGAVQDGNGNPVTATITFTSDDPSIATVNAAGNVTAQGPGTTAIVIAASGLSTSIPVTVAAAPHTMSGGGGTLTLHPEETLALGIAVVDCHGDDAGVAITYSGLNTSVATIAPNGDLTGIAYGATSVTATAGALNQHVSIDVIGRPTLGSATPVVLTGNPFGVAISSAGLVYVTRIGTSTLGRGTIPLTAFSTNPITVGNTAAHVAINPAGTTAYVTNQGSNTLSVVNTATHTETMQIPLGNSAFNLIVSPDGGTVYATVDVGTVYVINATTNAIVDSFFVGSVPNGLAFSPDGTSLYVSSRDAGWVVVYDTLSNTMVDTLVTGGMPQRLAVSADGGELYIGNEQLGLDIWNLNTDSRITSIPMEGYGIALSPDNTTLYVSNPSFGTVKVVNRALRTVITTLTPGGTPRNIVFSRYGVEALIANQADFVTVVR